jgi:hypothetical protein
MSAPTLKIELRNPTRGINLAAFFGKDLMEMAMKLELINCKGQTLRMFAVDSDRALVVRRQDSGRIELHLSLDHLNFHRVGFDLLGSVERDALSVNDFVYQAQDGDRNKGDGGIRFRLVPSVAAAPLRDQSLPEDPKGVWRACFAVVSVLASSFIALALVLKSQTAAVEQNLKQQVVRIVKQISIKPAVDARKDEPAQPVAQVKPTVETPKTTVNVKRLGAVAVLGALSKSKQKGGLNLDAANTTAGPGLGGTAGSGGTQTTLYGKGLVAAPVGAGANMQGAGGYGTKGKGGGQASYGTLSLVGSSGAAPVPLGREAIIEGGLDRDLISGVIDRNMGQVRFCYEQALQADPGLAGRVAIAFVIGANGQVKSAAVENTTVNSKQVEECIVLRLRSWRFPLPSGGVDVKVSYPFVLRRSGQA